MKIETLEIGQVYRSYDPDSNFWMIAKIKNNKNQNNDIRNICNDFEYMISSNGLFSKNDYWCYFSTDGTRNYQLATPEQIYWLEQCIEADKFIYQKDLDYSKMHNNYEIY